MQVPLYKQVFQNLNPIPLTGIQRQAYETIQRHKDGFVGFRDYSKPVSLESLILRVKQSLLFIQFDLIPNFDFSLDCSSFPEGFRYVKLIGGKAVDSEISRVCLEIALSWSNDRDPLWDWLAWTFGLLYRNTSCSKDFSLLLLPNQEEVLVSVVL